MTLSHEDIVKQIILKELGEDPINIERIKSGIDNEVYAVSLVKQGVIVRMNKNDIRMRGSEYYIPLLKSRGVKVPEIIASDYSQTAIPVSYQIMSRLPGENLREVMTTLTDEQLENLAKEIADVFNKIATLSPSTKFGWLSYNKEKQFSTWLDYLENRLETVRKRNKELGIVGDFYVDQMERLIKENAGYFGSVTPTPYFDDISSKNVMIDNGSFSGLVDLDIMSSGDPLDAVGIIKADWAGTHQGMVYTNALMNALNLGESQRRLVTVYAVLNRIFWLSEKGIKFNENTSTTVNQERLAKDKEATNKLLKELELK